MYAILEFTKASERGFTLDSQYNREAGFGVILYNLSGFQSQDNDSIGNRSVKGFLYKNPYPPRDGHSNVFDCLRGWQESIQAFKKHSETNTLAIADIRTISTLEIRDIIDNIRKQSNDLVYALEDWWSYDRETENIRANLRNLITGSSNFHLFIKTDNSYIKILPWEQLINRWISKNSRPYVEHSHHISVSFISQPNNIDLHNNSVENIFLNKNNSINVLAIIGSDIDDDLVNSNLDQIKNSLQESSQNSDSNLSINIQREKPSNCRQFASLIQKHDFDIFVFIGHSDVNRNSRQTANGIIQLHDEQITIAQLKRALKSRVVEDNRHRLLIFTSCSSLGLAEDVMSIIENVSCISYKEAVTNTFALNFLRSFFINLRKPSNYNLDMVMSNTKDDLFFISGDDDISEEVSWFPILSFSSCRNILINHPITTDWLNFSRKFEEVTNNFFGNVISETRYTVLMRTILGGCLGAILYFFEVEYSTFLNQFGFILGLIVFLLGYYYLIGIKSINRKFRLFISLCPIIIASIVLALLFNKVSKIFEFSYILFVEVLVCSLIGYLSPKVVNLFYR